MGTTVGVLLRQDLDPQRSEFDADFSFKDDSSRSVLQSGSIVVWRGRLASNDYLFVFYVYYNMII